MTNSSAPLDPGFRVGTRGSPLARLQTCGALERLTALCPGIHCTSVTLASPGDRDKQTDLKTAPADFFTRDLDDAILDGRLDCAVHSAKDLPAPLRAGLDWFWLPWREDRRDALILPPGAQVATLGAAPRIGVSSERREDYARRRYPDARLMPLRGTIEERLAQLDAGDFDALLMAGAALVRLGLEARITEWIALDELPTPEAQGSLAVTFREDDPRLLRLRALFLKPVVCAGAGSGAAEHCTVAVRDALARCDVCLHDSLLDARLLDAVPADARIESVGKRCGAHSVPQEETVRRLLDYSRRGLRVVRLKGGDPGIFGRLAEEIEALEARHLPYRVLPGLSSLALATTGTGMLLTRRGVANGFTVMTPREAGGGVSSINASARRELPLVFFTCLAD